MQSQEILQAVPSTQIFHKTAVRVRDLEKKSSKLFPNDLFTVGRGKWGILMNVTRSLC